MNKKYLSDETIKGLKDFINSKLTKDIRATLLEMKLKTGIDCWHSSKELKEALWKYAKNEIKNNNNEITVQLDLVINKGDWQDASKIIQTYINKHYQKEWNIIHKYNPEEIEDRLNGICGIMRKYKLQRLDINDLIEAININDLIDQRYGKKYCDKEAIKLTDDILTGLDKLFNNKSVKDVNKIMYAFKVYYDSNSPEQYKDKALFHNIIIDE